MRGEYLGDAAHESLLAELNERSAVISTHPMEIPSGPVMEGLPPFMCDFLLDTTRAAINLILHGTLDRYPNLSFILPHGGGFLPYMATRLELFTHMLTRKSSPRASAITCIASTTTPRHRCPPPPPPR